MRLPQRFPRRFPRWSVRKPGAHGNALIEYVVPAAILLLSAGILITTTDINKILGDYFMATSGHTNTDLTGGVFKTQALAGPGYGNPGNGIEGFNNFGVIEDGNGTPTGESASGNFYYGAVSRSGARPVPTSAEYLYP